MPNEDPKKSAPDDSELFREAVQDVKPLASDKISLRQPAKRVLKRSIVQPMADRLSDEFIPPCDNWLEFMRPGVQRTVFKQLRTGKLPVESRLDLHGMTRDAARITLQQFLQQNISQNGGKGSRGRLTRQRRAGWAIVSRWPGLFPSETPGESLAPGADLITPWIFLPARDAGLCHNRRGHP